MHAFHEMTERMQSNPEFQHTAESLQKAADIAKGMSGEPIMASLERKAGSVLKGLASGIIDAVSKK